MSAYLERVKQLTEESEAARGERLNRRGFFRDGVNSMPLQKPNDPFQMKPIKFAKSPAKEEQQDPYGESPFRTALQRYSQGTEGGIGDLLGEFNMSVETLGKKISGSGYPEDFKNQKVRELMGNYIQRARAGSQKPSPQMPMQQPQMQSAPQQPVDGGFNANIQR